MYLDLSHNSSFLISGGKLSNPYGIGGTSVGRGASAAIAEKAITGMKSNTDLKGSEFNKLKFRSIEQTSKSITLTWAKNKKARKYVIYGNKCGKGTRPKKLATVKGTRKTLKRIAGKKLKKGTCFIYAYAQNGVFKKIKVVVK